MRLSLNCFFSHLTFNPFKAETKKDQATALVTSIACGILLVGIFYAMNAIRRLFTHRYPSQMTEQDRRIAAARDFAIETKKKIQAAIPTNVKAVLNKLFEGTSYSMSTIPIYPAVYNSKTTEIEGQLFKGPLTQGVFDDGRPFIAIKVKCTLTEENVNRLVSTGYDKKQYSPNSYLTSTIVLYQSAAPGPLPLCSGATGENVWDQLSRIHFMKPSFFTSHFTSPRSGELVDSQFKHFKSIQTLLKTGQSQDVNGLIWHLSKD